MSVGGGGENCMPSTFSLVPDIEKEVISEDYVYI